MSSKDRIMAILDAGGKLTSLTIWREVGTLDGRARVSHLRRQGYPIRTEYKWVKNRFGERVRVAVWSKERGTA